MVYDSRYELKMANEELGKVREEMEQLRGTGTGEHLMQRNAILEEREMEREYWHSQLVAAHQSRGVAVEQVSHDMLERV